MKSIKRILIDKRRTRLSLNSCVLFLSREGKKYIMINTIMHPLEIGKEKFKWDWSNRFNCIAAVIGDNESSAKQKFIQQIAYEISQKDNQSVFWIGPRMVRGKELNEDGFVLDLLEFESHPTSEKHVAHEFESERMQLVQVYLKILSLVKGIKREDLVPLASYQKHVEGPLHGYLRAIDSIENTSHKEWIDNQFSGLKRIKWEYQDGYRYVYDSHISDEEGLLDLFKGVWSFWALTSTFITPQQLLLVVDIPKVLTDINTPKEIKSIVKELLEILSKLSEKITLTVMISTETMFPIPELNIRHQLFLKYDSLDYDWRVPSNQNFFPAEVLDGWIRNEPNKGVWFDFFSGEVAVLTQVEDVCLSKNEQIIEEIKDI